mmetsp:Transcript_42314/g.83082  ORF Transcript_42314/g.83082 Transcript_42314/m.83082 type:complete len:223 (+) Transcript_42314:94-762(+)
MSGLGRRSHYRKHVMEGVRQGNYVVPDYPGGERIGRVIGSRGGNLFEVDVAQAAGSPQGLDVEDEGRGRRAELALLPTKFKNLIYVKRGDYVVVSGTDDAEDESKIRWMVRHILFRDQVAYLRDGKAGPGIWPERFVKEGGGGSADGAVVAAALAAARERTGGGGGERAGSKEGEGIGDNEDEEYLSSDPEDDGDLFVNTNRMAAIHVYGSSDDSSSESDRG